MSMPGSHTWAQSLQKYLPWAMLSALVLLIFTSLKKMSTSTNSSTVYNLFLTSGFNETLSKFATAQAAHETAGFTSALFLANNNCFGMKYSGQVNADKHEKNGFADYSDINHSVADLIAWYSRHRTNIFSLPLFINTLESYVKFLKNNDYFEADETAYLKGCQYYYNQIFDGKS